MNQIEFVSKIIATPWNIDRLRGRTIIASIASAVLRNQRPSEDIFGDPLPAMQLAGNTAIIPLTGCISMNVPDWCKSYGINLTDANDIEEEIQLALDDSNIELIVFDVDSPGGSSLAGDKLFDVVEAANRKKPCFAFCGDGRDMASTAYEAIAACRTIYAGWYADGVGCIGSYCAFLDDSGYWEQLGIKIEVFRSGELKGIGEDALSQAQRDYLQQIVDEAGARFRKNVRKYRTEIDPADMTGAWFTGSEAAKKGFVAGNVDNLQTAVRKFQRML